MLGYSQGAEFLLNRPMSQVGVVVDSKEVTAAESNSKRLYREPRFDVSPLGGILGIRDGGS